MKKMFVLMTLLSTSLFAQGWDDIDYSEIWAAANNSGAIYNGSTANPSYDDFDGHTFPSVYSFKIRGYIESGNNITTVSLNWVIFDQLDNILDQDAIYLDNYQTIDNVKSWRMPEIVEIINLSNPALIFAKKISISFVGVGTITASDGPFIANFTFDDSSLPVDMAAFYARCSGRSVILEWNTESETDNLGFMIERSPGGETAWMTIASYQTDVALQGSGSTSSRTNYIFTDLDVKYGETFAYRLSAVSTDGEIMTYAPLSITLDALPETTHMEKAYPNPFNPTTYIGYHLAEDSQVEIFVFDLLGRKVRTLFTGQQLAGNYHVYWHGECEDGIKAANGNYIIRMQTQDEVQIQWVTLLK